MKKRFNVYKMTCSACSSRVQNHISKLDGINSCTVNLLTNSMDVDVCDYVTDDLIIKEVYSIGYEAKPYKKEKTKDNFLGKKLSYKININY